MSSQTGDHKEKLEPDWEWQAQLGFQPFSSWVNFHKQKTCSSVKGWLTHACALDLWNRSSLRASASGLVPVLAISSRLGLPSRDEESASHALILVTKAEGKGTDGFRTGMGVATQQDEFQTVDMNPKVALTSSRLDARALARWSSTWVWLGGKCCRPKSWLFLPTEAE